MGTQNGDEQRKPPIPFGAPDAMLQDGLTMFRDLLRIDTTNPPGNEELAANKCIDWLNDVGVQCRTHDDLPGRRNVVACIGPEENAIILSAHLDVVPADPEQWTYPPFDAVEAEGCIWGRGAIDMKHMAAYGLAIMRNLAGRQEELTQGVKLVLVADEEAGCTHGSLSLAEKHPDWLQGSVALTECGAFTTWIDEHRVYPIQVAEKGFVWLRLKIHGEPGHGSMPHKENALIKLADIIDQLADQPFPFQRTEPVNDFINGISKIVGFPKGTALKGLGKKAFSNFVLENLIKDPDKIKVFNALLRHTCSPTMAQGGTKSNVIPGEAELTVDCRILPGTDPDDFVRQFKERVQGHYDLEVIKKGPPVVVSRANPVYDRIVKLIEEADPGSHCVPQMLTGFTDARAFDAVGVPCFGFSPIWLPPEIRFASMFHGHNERIPIHGFKWGLACLWELVQRSCIQDHTGNES